MTIIPATNLACPLDGERLQLAGRSLVCPQGHTFDYARQGYVNLLPAQHKKSRAPGDSKAMVAARQRFLEQGYYAPIAARLLEQVKDYLPSSQACLLDAGSGEGYYLDYLARHLEGALSLIGMDIAKPAVLAAARRNRELDWLVASNRQPPLQPNSVDLIICMFGFPVYEAFRKILKPGGHVLLVEAGPRHLIELRRVIYPTLKAHVAPDLSVALAQGFSLCAESELNYVIEALPKDALADLLMMTPHLFRASHEGKQAAASLQQIDLSVDVSFRCLTRADVV